MGRDLGCRRGQFPGDRRGRKAVSDAHGAASWLSLVATPAFAFMALQTAAHGGAADILCSAAQGASPFSGMVTMYLLMSVFHSAPWVKAARTRYRRAAS